MSVLVALYVVNETSLVVARASTNTVIFSLTVEIVSLFAMEVETGDGLETDDVRSKRKNHHLIKQAPYN